MTVRDFDYAELRPDQLDARLQAAPVAYVPWGALEWHSVHLPVGLDGIVAENVAERAVERTGGVVLPTMFLPITALPHRFSISFGAETVRAVLRDLLGELARIGVRVVVLLSGHYAQGHELVLIEAAEYALDRWGVRVLATPPLALLGDDYLDHAGRWETSQLLASRPDLVDMRRYARALDQFPGGHVADFGVLGESPQVASAFSGETVLVRAVEAIEAWVQQLLRADDPQPLREFYARRRAAYQPFVDQYLHGSYEDAAAAWWADRVKRD